MHYLEKWVDSSDHRDFIRRFQDQEEYYARGQQGPLQDAMRWMRLYFGKLKDERRPNERWRANMKPSTLVSAVESLVAIRADLMTQGDPPIQASGSTTTAFRSEQKIERLLEHALYINKWPSEITGAIRMAIIQGTAPFKVQWMNERRQGRRVTPDERLGWLERFAEVQKMAGQKAPDPTKDEDLFELWRETVNNAHPDARLPKYPRDNRDMTVFHGPLITQPNLYDLRFDPFEKDFSKQVWVAERIVKPKSWLMDNSGDDPTTSLFSRRAIESAMRKASADGRQFNELQEETYRLLGLEPRDETDPMYEEAVELYELYQPYNEEHPHCVVLNREQVINWSCQEYPFAHGKVPFVMLRGVSFSNSAYGRSELDPVEDIFKEERILRNLRLDAVTLKVLPVFAKQAGVGIADIQRMLAPGGIVDVPGVPGQSIQPLLGNYQVPTEAFAEITSLKEELAAAMATYPQVMGETATVGRVPLGESSSRFKQALTRIKQTVVEYEMSLHELPKMILSNYLEFGDEEEQVYIAGDKITFKYNRNELSRAIDLNFEFHGASQALTKEQRVQELIAITKHAGEQSLLSPKGGRELLARTLELAGLKNVKSIVDDNDTDLMQEAWQADLQARITQAQAASAPQEMAEAPDEIPVEEAGMLQQGEQGGQAPTQ